MATLSEVMEQVLSLAPEAVAMTQQDGNILISLNMTLSEDFNTLVPHEMDLGEED